MKKISKLMITIIFILIIVGISTQSYGAMQIVKDATPKKSITVTNSFAYCYNLRLPSTTLGNNTLDPHLTLNSDWGIVAYLAASVYGTNNASGTVSNSTTGNESGVKNFGYNCTQTSSLIEGAGNNANISNLQKNKNTKYVEILSATSSIDTTRGKAFEETKSFAGSFYYPTVDNPVAIRSQVFGSQYITQYGSQNANKGEANLGTTFRPVIWN